MYIHIIHGSAHSSKNELKTSKKSMADTIVGQLFYIYDVM